MWSSDSPKKKASVDSARTSKPRLENGLNASTSRLSSKPQSLMKRALSFQFLNQDDPFLTSEQKAFIRMRYRDVAKYVIWPSCRFDPHPIIPKAAPLEPTDGSATLFRAEIEDDRTPYLPPTINHVLRSDSEDSSDAEEIVAITRL